MFKKNHLSNLQRCCDQNAINKKKLNAIQINHDKNMAFQATIKK